MSTIEKPTEIMSLISDWSGFRSLKNHRFHCKTHLPSGYIRSPCHGSEQRNQRNRIFGDTQTLCYTIAPMSLRIFLILSICD